MKDILTVDSFDLFPDDDVMVTVNRETRRNTTKENKNKETTQRLHPNRQVVIVTWVELN